MQLRFEKWHGCRNDFILTWLPPDDQLVFDSLRRQAAKLCSRQGDSIGADGIIVLHVNKAQDLLPDHISIINSDGSLAKTCGNGLRCAALSVLKRNRELGNPNELPEAVTLSVEGRDIEARFLGRSKVSGKADAWPLVAVNMGETTVHTDGSLFDAVKQALIEVGQESAAPQLATDFGVCEVGNPHIVIFLDDANRDLLHRVGPALQKNSSWDGINVHLVCSAELTNADKTTASNLLSGEATERFTALVWERGAGPTQACGSGACAIAACAWESGTTERGAWVAVDMPGGRLYVRQDDADDQITLAGPGELSFQGVVEI